jgi:hypothetical protein
MERKIFPFKVKQMDWSLGTNQCIKCNKDVITGWCVGPGKCLCEECYNAAA